MGFGELQPGTLPWVRPCLVPTFQKILLPSSSGVSTVIELAGCSLPYARLFQHRPGVVRNISICSTIACRQPVRHAVAMVSKQAKTAACRQSVELSSPSVHRQTVAFAVSGSPAGDWLCHLRYWSCVRI